MATIFSRIAAGEIPSYRVASDEGHFAFLDINPVTPGHVLVIPRMEEDYIFNLPENEYDSLWKFARRVAEAMKKAISCKRIAVVVMGMEVPHVHIHLLPINSEGDINFTRKIDLPAAEMEAIAAAIAAEFK